MGSQAKPYISPRSGFPTCMMGEKQAVIVDSFSENKNVKFMGGKESIWTSVTGRVLVFPPQNLDFLPSKLETRWD